MLTLTPGPPFPGVGQMAITYAIAGTVCLILMKVFGFWKPKQF